MVLRSCVLYQVLILMYICKIWQWRKFGKCKETAKIQWRTFLKYLLVWDVLFLFPTYLNLIFVREGGEVRLSLRTAFTSRLAWDKEAFISVDFMCFVVFPSSIHCWNINPNPIDIHSMGEMRRQLSEQGCNNFINAEIQVNLL